MTYDYISIDAHVHQLADTFVDGKKFFGMFFWCVVNVVNKHAIVAFQADTGVNEQPLEELLDYAIIVSAFVV